MSSPGILVIGERLPELQALLGAITSQPIPPAATTHSWTIDNKYYNAKVEINLITLSDNLAVLPSDIDHQAVVALFSATAPPANPLAQAQQLWAQVEAHDKDYEIKIAVVVCDQGIVGGESRPEWLDQVDSWFAERFVELIVVENFERRGGGDSRPAAKGGAEGVDRIVEALEAHIWPGMERKRPLQGGGRGAPGESGLSAEAAELLRSDPNRDALLGGSLGDVDDLDTMFSEILDFRMRMAGADRTERANAAADMIMRLRSFMGEATDEEASDEDDDGGGGSAAEEEQNIPPMANGNTH